MFDTIRIATLVAALAASALLPSANTAHASKFGTDEELHAYAKTGMHHNKEPVDLCYKTETFHIIAPVYTIDEMVLCDPKKKTYWPVPTGDKLKKLQDAKLMPSPLPAYERPTLDYALGYSFWLVLAVLGVFAGVKAIRSKTRKTNEPGATDPTA